MTITRARWSFIGVLAAAATAGVLALGGTSSQAATGSGASASPNAKQALIHQAQQRLGGRPVAWDRAHPTEARARLESAEAALRAQAQKFQAGYRVPGDRIVATKDSAFAPDVFQVRNSYDGTVNRHQIRVSAGCAMAGEATAAHCAHGAVGIWASTASGGLREVGVFAAPTTSPLAVTAFHGTDLTLRSAAGQAYTFSLVTHRFS
jgi:hypothetical protein